MPHPGILFMRLIAPLPLSWIRGLGAVLGWVLYPLVAPRRKVVLTNLALCFPEPVSYTHLTLPTICSV